MLCGEQMMATSPAYVAKIPVPQTTNTIGVPIFSQFLHRAKDIISATQAKHLLKWGMHDAIASINPLQHHKLSLHISQVKDTLQGHAAVFDADLLTERMDSTTKTRLSYKQLTAVHADIVRSLQENEQFQQAFALNTDDMEKRTQSLQNLIANYRIELDTESTANNIELASRLVEARLNAVVHVNSFDRETVRKQLSQKFALLDIAQQNAELGTYLALRFALLHHLYQQQIALRLTTDIATHERNELERERRFHQAREEFSRTLYLLLQQDKS